MSFIKEFREFAMRGNVVDMAVGVIIGGAFGKIVSSLVSDIAQGDVPAVTLNYGVFIQNVIDFIIIAFAIFMMIKALNKVRKPEEKKAGPTSEDLLTEIRDLLKNK